MRAGALALALVLAVGAPDARAFVRARTAHGALVRWPKATLVVDVGGAPGGARGARAFRRALASWNAIEDAALLLVEAERDAQADVRVVVAPHASWPHGDTVVAHTALDVDVDRGVARRATITLRDDAAFSTTTPPAPGALDLESVLLHELGHALGLAHSRDRRAVMAAGRVPGEVRRALTDDERRALATLFPRGAR